MPPKQCMSWLKNTLLLKNASHHQMRWGFHKPLICKKKKKKENRISKITVRQGTVKQSTPAYPIIMHQNKMSSF